MEVLLAQMLSACASSLHRLSRSDEELECVANGPEFPPSALGEAIDGNRVFLTGALRSIHELVNVIKDVPADYDAARVAEYNQKVTKFTELLTQRAARQHVQSDKMVEDLNAAWKM